MLKLKALLLTQGMHGMISQTEGLAKALGLKFRHERIQLKSFWNLIPPKFTPINENILKRKFICDAKVIISCGRKSVVPSIVLKKRFKTSEDSCLTAISWFFKTETPNPNFLVFQVKSPKP